MQESHSSPERAPVAFDPDGNGRGKPSGYLIASVMVMGVLQLSLAEAMLGRSDASLAYNIGYALGGAIVLPLAAIGIACLFKSMRKPTPILIVLLSVWSLSIFGTCASRMSNRIEAAEDARKFEELKAQAKVIEQEILESDDPREILRLQRELTGLLKTENTQLSKGASDTLELVNDVVGPFGEDAIKYTESVIPVFASIETALEEPSLAALNDANDALQPLIESAGRLRERAASLRQDLERYLVSSDLSSRARHEVSAGFDKGYSRRGPLIEESFRLEQELWKSMSARLRFLAEHWGRWESGGENFVFEGDLAERYNQLVAEFQALADKQTDTRRELAEFP